MAYRERGSGRRTTGNTPALPTSSSGNSTGDDHSHTRSKIEQLVDAFAAHIRELKSPTTNEATIRQSYIDPFWDALGWWIGEQHRLGPAEAEVIIERSIHTAEGPRFRSRRPDYIFRVNGFTRFIVQAKKPFIDLDRDQDAIYQANLLSAMSNVSG